MRWDERGVSPVIGVILTVAITVILAAVIGTFVLDLGSSGNVPAESVNDSVGESAVTESVDVGNGVRRFVDREAGVVCYRSDEDFTVPTGLSCLPLNDTRLGGES